MRTVRIAVALVAVVVMLILLQWDAPKTSTATTLGGTIASFFGGWFVADFGK